MEATLHHIAHYLALVLEALGLLVILVGAIEATIGMLQFVLGKTAGTAARRTVWLQFAHWLAAALTFQLGADIVQTTITPSWTDIGRVAAIAAIRTFLMFFLDRDIEVVNTLRRQPTLDPDAERA